MRLESSIGFDYTPEMRNLPRIPMETKSKSPPALPAIQSGNFFNSLRLQIQSAIEADAVRPSCYSGESRNPICFEIPALEYSILFRI
jgi:hypothetical protein